MNKKYTSLVLALVLLGTTATAIPALADDNSSSTPNQNWASSTRMMGRPEGVRLSIKPTLIGNVSAINGTSITLNARMGIGLGYLVRNPKAPSNQNNPVFFTIDATNATVIKNMSTSSVSNIAVGDTLLVEGTASGTSMVATLIRDGIMHPGEKNMRDNSKKMMGSTTATSTMFRHQDNEGSTTINHENNPPRPGFFSRIGGFFRHFFGF